MKRNDIDLIPFYSRVYRYESKQEYHTRILNDFYGDIQSYTYTAPSYEPLRWTVTYNVGSINTVSSNEVTTTSLNAPTAQLFYMDYIMPSSNVIP